MEKMDLQVSKLPNSVFFFTFSVVKILCFSKASLTLARLQEMQNSVAAVVSFQHCTVLYHIGVCKGGTRKTLIAISYSPAVVQHYKFSAAF